MIYALYAYMYGTPKTNGSKWRACAWPHTLELRTHFGTVCVIIIQSVMMLQHYHSPALAHAQILHNHDNPYMHVTTFSIKSIPHTLTWYKFMIKLKTYTDTCSASRLVTPWPLVLCAPLLWPFTARASMRLYSGESPHAATMAATSWQEQHN
jgi:hypothetical protein